jgi:hypothetical protein
MRRTAIPENSQPDFSRGLQISPSLTLLTVRRLSRDNAELVEEVKQLRAAVNIYRELAGCNQSEEKCRID